MNTLAITTMVKAAIAITNGRDAGTCITPFVASRLCGSAVAPADAGRAAPAEWSAMAPEAEGLAMALAVAAELGQASKAMQ